MIDDHGPSVIGGASNDCALWPDIEFGTLKRNIGPVRVVSAGANGPGIVGGGLDAAGDPRVQAVSPNDDARFLTYGGAADGVTLDARDPLAIHEEILDRKALANLGPGCRGRLDQEGVQDGATRGVRVGDVPARPPRVDRGRGGLQHDGTKIDALPPHWRAVRGDHALEQAPPLEGGDSRLMDVVDRKRIAGEARLVQQQNSIALPGEQHGCWRAGATSADHDRVVHWELLPSRRPR